MRQQAFASIAALAAVGVLAPLGATAAMAQAAASASPRHALVQRYCVTCHNNRLKTAGLVLDSLDVERPGTQPEVWEKVIAKLRVGAMPPTGSPRPDKTSYANLITWLETELDRAWVASPNPGRIGAVHRLNRTQYNNAVRDLFALDVDVRSQLPGDETADGSFDNFADSLSISTAHLERYLSVARQVTRLAVGLPPTTPGLAIFEVPLHIVQNDRQSDDLPLGSRGGLAVTYQVPVDGEYLMKVRLRRQYQDYLMGMGWEQQLDLRVDGKLVKRFSVGGKAPGRPAAASYAGDGEPGFAGAPEWEEYMQLGGDAHLTVRVPMTAGPRSVGVSFVREMWEPEGLPQPLQRGRVLTNDQIYMDNAAVAALHISGPFQSTGPATDTPSRRAVFVCQPKSSADEQACASRILSRIARLAYRRPIAKADVDSLMTFFAEGRKTDGGSFDTGIQFALERMLVDPDFLLRVYRERGGAAKTRSYALNDVELASRLSFFLWGSIPDARLLDIAEKGQLARPAVLEQEVKRMLADKRAADTLSLDFAAQWLNLRRVDEVVAHPDVYPSFDDSLLEAFRVETEMFVSSTVEEDRSVLDLIRGDYTFVNERLARHYNIPDIYGSRFRRVTLPDMNQRGGILSHGSLLATTSYPDRTSPVVRGKWLLENIFGVTVPAPPPGVNTSLPEPATGTKPPTIRERLSQHRRQAVCASCHAVIDPSGFALENFDAIGAYRTIDESGKPVDSMGNTVDGTPIDGLKGLRALLLNPKDRFPHTVAEKLLAYALGRRIEYYDRPAIRQIVRDAEASDYKWSAIVLGIVKSPAFLRRGTSTATN
jgi:mono/diheme cytochrome c family protein